MMRSPYIFASPISHIRLLFSVPKAALILLQTPIYFYIIICRSHSRSQNITNRDKQSYFRIYNISLNYELRKHFETLINSPASSLDGISTVVFAITNQNNLLFLDCNKIVCSVLKTTRRFCQTAEL